MFPLEDVHQCGMLSTERLGLSTTVDNANYIAQSSGCCLPLVTCQLQLVLLTEAPKLIDWQVNMTLDVQ